MNFFETFYKSYKMSLTCLDHRMLKTRTRQFLVNLLEVKLWMVHTWCIEYWYSNKIYVYKKMKMIWLQLQWNSNKYGIALYDIHISIYKSIGYEYKHLFEVTSNLSNFGTEGFWFMRFLFASLSKNSSYDLFYSCCISLLSNKINHQVLICILHHIILSFPVKRIHRLINWWFLNASHIVHWYKMTLFLFLYY